MLITASAGRITLGNALSGLSGGTRMAALAAALALLTPAPATAIPRYTITDLGDLPGGADYSIAHGINNNGQVVGLSESMLGQHAFIWDSIDGMIDINPLLGEPVASAAYGINDREQVVGVAGNHAYIWDSVKGMKELGALPDEYAIAHGNPEYSVANAINDLGQVAGRSGTAFGRAFLWQEDTGMVDIGDLPDGRGHTFALGMNNNGQVVGQSSTATGDFAFRWQDGVMVGLGDLPGGFDYSIAMDINNRGQVVGQSSNSAGDHAFLWQHGVITDLGDLEGGSGYSFATGINNSSQVVGWSADRADIGITSSAVLWQDDEIFDLNDLLTDPSGWNLTEATAINDIGQIVGYGNHDGFTRGFLLTPVDMVPPHPAAAPDTLDLARLALHVYPDSRASDIGDFESLGVIPGGEFDLRLPFAEAFIRRGENGGRDQIVISIRGTQTWVDALRDLEISGIPPILLQDMLESVAGFTGAIRAQYPLADFTFTGHSLGGAAATILATISGVDAETFNSPGTHNLISNDRRDALAALVGAPVSASQDVTNYRHSSDPVSILGAPEGGVLTVHDVAFEALPPLPVHCLPCHSMTKMLDLLGSGAAQTPGYTPSLIGDIAVVFPNAFAIGGVRKFFNALTDGDYQLFDPHLVGDVIEIDLGLSDVMINGILVGGLPGDEFPLQAFSDDAWFDIGTLFSYVPMDVASYPKYRIYNASNLVDDFGNYIIGLRFDGVGTFKGSIGMIETSPSVPEPVTLSLLGAGLAGLGLMRRRRAA